MNHKFHVLVLLSSANTAVHSSCTESVPISLSKTHNIIGFILISFLLQHNVCTETEQVKKQNLLV